MFAYIKNCVWKWMIGWDEKNLSTGGKEVLLNFAVHSIPTFTMSVFNSLLCCVRS